MHVSLPIRALTVAVLCSCGIAAHRVHGQGTVNADSPKLTEPFTFNLAPHRDYAVSELTKSLEQHDELQRSKELEAATAPVLATVFDLLRYVPFRLGGSDSGDESVASYLRPDYTKLPPETHLLDTR